MSEKLGRRKKVSREIIATKMDYLYRRSCTLSRMDRITVDEITKKTKADKIYILSYTEERRLMWYGHVRIVVYNMRLDKGPICRF